MSPNLHDPILHFVSVFHLNVYFKNSRYKDFKVWKNGYCKQKYQSDGWDK